MLRLLAEMIMAVESDLRQRVGKVLRENGFMVQPIETGAIMEGVPDLWYSRQFMRGDVAALGRVMHNMSVTISGWLELKKITEMPKKSTTAVFKSLNHPLSIEQENWIEQAIDHGSRADILVGYGREYFFVPGIHASRFNEMTERDLRFFTVQKLDIPKMLLVPSV